MLLRSYRGEEITKSLPVQIPRNARGSVVGDGRRRHPPVAVGSARAAGAAAPDARLPQMLQVLNSARKNNRLYVRLLTRDGGAVVKGESLAALPPSVLAVMESDRNGGSFRPLQSAVLGEWEIPTDQAVSGSRTLTLPLED